MIHDTQSAQISQKQDERNIYAIMKTMCPPGYHHNVRLCTIMHELPQSHCGDNYIYLYYIFIYLYININILPFFNFFEILKNLRCSNYRKMLEAYRYPRIERQHFV